MSVFEPNLLDPPVAGFKHPLENYRPAGLLEAEEPAVVQYERGKGYPWPPFSTAPTGYFLGASSIGKWQEDWGWYQEIKHSRIAVRYRQHLANYPTDDDAERFLRECIRDESKEAMRAGTRFHEWSARLDAGLNPGVYPERCAEGWRDAWALFEETYGVEYLAVERAAYAPSLRVAGTIDRIARIHKPPRIKGLTLEPGCVVVVDLKTTSKRAKEVKLSKNYVWQISALGQATHIAIEETQDVVAIPRFDGGVIVSVTSDGKPVCRWVDIHDPSRVAAIQAHAYARDISNKTTTADFGTVHVLEPVEGVEDNG